MVPVLPKFTEIGLEIFVTYAFYIFVSFYQYIFWLDRIWCLPKKFVPRI
jgi:hypothetical protein